MRTRVVAQCVFAIASRSGHRGKTIVTRSSHLPANAMKEQVRSYASNADEWKISFCGNFGKAFPMTQELLQNDDTRISVDQVSPQRIIEEGKNSDILVPLMSKFDDNMISTLKHQGKLKAIVQFGVGVEGIDLQSAEKNDVPVLNMPSGPTGNALSTAEHALFLALSLLRRTRECDARLD